MNLKGLFLEELQEIFCSLELPKYRADQVYQWLYQKQVCNWDQVTVFSKELRQFFRDNNFSLNCLTIKKQVADNDGTIKFLFELEDCLSVESVYIPENDRQTVCISTQVGCGMGCLFCATGHNGLKRNLAAAEIIDQLLRITKVLGKRITNLVIMGQGEPLANYEQTLKSVKIINDPKGIGLGARHITISTCGLVPGIKKLAKEPLQINLAISLHAADDQLRQYIMPVNKVYPLFDLIQACREYIENTGRRITFEYILIDKVNDRPEDLNNLVRLLSGMLCHVNLIPYNSFPDSIFKRSKPERIREFERVLNQAHIETTIRKERGTNTAAACGQLQGKI